METDEQQFNTHEYFSKLLHTEPTNDHDFISNVSDLANEVVSLVQSCHDIDIMKTVKKHMQSAISLLNAKSGTAQDKEVFEPATKIAPNSNHIQQLRFFQLKKKRNTRKRWAKPTRDEEETTKTAIKVCGVCWKKTTKEIVNIYHGSNVKFVVYGFMSCAMVIKTMTHIYVALV